MAIERKHIPIGVAGLELKAAADGSPAVVEGYASTFGGDPDSYGDLIAPGAYAQTIRDWATRAYALPMLVDHYGLPGGKWIDLAEDARGLRVLGELTPGNIQAGDILASLKHGVITGLSSARRKTRVLLSMPLIFFLKVVRRRPCSRSVRATQPAASSSPQSVAGFFGISVPCWASSRLTAA
jgi:HK97 family phage prohead protease